MTTNSEFEINPLVETKIVSLKLLFTALYRAHELDFFGHYGQDQMYNIIKLRFYFSGLRK